MGLEDAINYRLVSQVVGFSVADRWGYKNNSEGYKELQRVFKDKYKLLTLEEFKDEIILAWIGESDNRKIVKKSMSQVLDEDRSDEQYRYLFNKICEKVKNKNKENLLTGIPNEIRENKEVIKNIIDIIDNGFIKIIELAKNKEVNFNFEKEEIDNIILAMKYLEIIKYDSNLDDFDNDSFLEEILKNYNKKINQAEIPAQKYTEQMKLEIKTNFYARLNTIPANKKARNRTKETIFDKIDSSKISEMQLEEFSMGYEEFVDFYDEINKNIQSIDGLIKFYNIESKYNLIFYINMAIDLFEGTSLSKKEVANKISKLALMDSYIYRSSRMRFEINKSIYNFDKEDESYEKVCNEVNELLVLKNTIVKDLLEVGSLKFESLKEEAFNIISSNSKAEIVNQIKKVDVVNYLGFNNDKKKKENILRSLKYLMENNNEILLQRSILKNTI